MNDKLWDVFLCERKEDEMEVGDEAEVGDEQWLASRRVMLGKKIEEIKRECAKLTTAKLTSLIPDGAIEGLRIVLRKPVSKTEFVDVMTDAILSDDTVAYSEEDLRSCIEELFFLVDVNGSGSLDWSELTHYIVHSYETRKESMNSHQPWGELYRHAYPAERCKKRKIYYFPKCDKTFTLDWCHTTALGDHSVLSVFLPQAHGVRPYATIKNDCSFEDAEWLNAYNQLVVSTANGLLKYFSIKDPKDETRGDTIHLLKHVYVEGMQLRLRLDTETNILFTGNNKGELFGIQPDDSPNEMPETVYRAKPHAAHPVVDLLPLPTIGAKKVVSCGLDSKCYINDVTTGTVERELIRENERDLIRSLSYSQEYALLATSGCYDPEPTLWTPLAGQFISKLRDIDAPHKGAIIGVHCVQQSEEGCMGGLSLQPWHLLSADSLGMLKVWDIRKVMVLQTFWLDPAVGDVAARLGVQDRTLAECKDIKTRQQLNVFDVAVDPRRGWLLSACRTDTERVTMVHRQVLFKHKNAYIAHDKAVSGLIYNAAAGCFITSSGRDVRLWDAATGSVKATYTDITKSVITAFAVDSHSRRFVVGCHDGAVSVHALATGGAAIVYDKAPSEVCGIFEVGEMVMVAAGRYLLGYKSVDGGGADDDRNKQPIFSMKLPAALLCHVKAAEFSMFAVGDTDENITIFDTYSTRIKPIATCQYQGPRDEREEPPVTEINQITERQIREYMHPKVNEISCVTMANPYPLLIASDYGGHLTMYTIRPHKRPYTCCGRGTIYKYHKAASTPVITCMMTNGMKLFTGDDHGCLTVWSLKPVINGWALHPMAFPSADYKIEAMQGGFNAPDVAQPTVINCIPAHRKLTPVSSICYVKEINGLATAGADCNIYLWDMEGERVGKMEQGRAFKEGETVIPPDYKAAYELFVSSGGGEKGQRKKSIVGSASSQTDDDSYSDSASDDPTHHAVICKPQLAVLPSVYYKALFPKDGVWKASGDTRQPPPFVLDEYCKPPPSRHHTLTPPPSPCDEKKKLKNRFITTATYADYHREGTEFRKRVEKPPKEALGKRREHILMEPPAEVKRARDKIETVYETVKGLVGSDQVVMFRRPRLTQQDMASVASALRSVPSAELTWKNKLPDVDNWITRCVKDFDPFETTAPKYCQWLYGDEDEEEAEDEAPPSQRSPEPPTPKAAPAFEVSPKPASRPPPSPWKPRVTNAALWRWSSSIPATNTSTQETLQAFTKSAFPGPVRPLSPVVEPVKRSLLAEAAFMAPAAAPPPPQPELSPVAEEEPEPQLSVAVAGDMPSVVAEELDRVKEELEEVRRFVPVRGKRYRKAKVPFRRPPMSKLSPLRRVGRVGPADAGCKYEVREDLNPVLEAHRRTIWTTSKTPPQLPASQNTLVHRLANNSAGALSPLLRSLALKVELSSAYRTHTYNEIPDVLVYRPLSAAPSGAPVVISSRPNSALKP